MKQRSSETDHHVLNLEQLALFRTSLCSAICEDSCPIPDRCANSHCLTWQRRNPLVHFYTATLCPDIEFIKKNNRMTLIRRCNRGRQCPHAHSKEEELYHPMVYKTKLCKAQPNCKRYFCPFAHSNQELNPRVPFDKYKALHESHSAWLQRKKAGVSSPTSHMVSMSSTEACTQSDADLWKTAHVHFPANNFTPPSQLRSPMSSPTIFHQTVSGYGHPLSPHEIAPTSGGLWDGKLERKEAQSDEFNIDSILRDLYIENEMRSNQVAEISDYDIILHDIARALLKDEATANSQLYSKPDVETTTNAAIEQILKRIIFQHPRV